MASNKHKRAKRKRDTAKSDRKDLVQDRKDARKAGASKSAIAAITRSIMNKSSEMRKQGDIMREETGREKGERTTYTGPAKQSTIDLIKSTTGDVLPESTKWQQVNKAWQDEMMEKHNLTRAQARTRLKTLFSKNRERYLTEQQRRYDANIVAPVVDDDEIIDDGRVKVGGKGGLTRATGVGATGLGGLMMETDPYRRAAPLDWSDIMPQDTPLQSQKEIISGGGKYYQPWATRQDTPLSLINYDKPRGNIPALSFIPPGTQVTAAYSGDTSGTTDDGKTDDGKTDDGKTSGVFYGQPYSNMAQYHALLARHNQAMQLIRGGHTQMGIGALMGNPGEIARLYALQPDKSDLAVGGESASIFDTLLGRNNQTVTGYPDYASGALASDAWGGGLMGFEDIKAANQGLIPAATTTASSTSNGILPFDFY